MIYRFFCAAGRMATLAAAPLALCGTALAGDFVPIDVTVSDPAVDLPDPEFDPVGDRMVWQDRAGNLWIADLDPATGDLMPTSGRGQKLDENLSGLILTGNGPEWGYGNGEVIITYTRQVGESRSLGLARQNAAGAWEAGVVGNNGSPGERWRPLSTDPGTVGPALISYIREFESGDVGVGWREADDATTEGGVLGAGSNGGQWAQGDRAFVSPQKVNDIFQLFWVDIDTEEVTQITDTGVNTLNAIPWLAPEYGDQLISAAMDATMIGIFRHIDGVWTLINTLDIPSTRPFIGSPEPFVHDGKSYVTVVASEEIGVGPLAFFPTGPSEIWIAGIDPNEPFYRRIDDGLDGPFRTEPEAYATDNGTVIYYTLRDMATGNAVLRRADTGLGPFTNPDVDADGVADTDDNCIGLQNTPQRDTDGDGIGNRCDADLDQNCLVNIGDLGLLKQAFFTAGDVDEDFDGDGIVGFGDLGIFRSLLFTDYTVDNPSGQANLCSPQ